MGEPSTTQTGAANVDKLAVLSELKRLLDSGALSEREFSAMKGVLLASSSEGVSANPDRTLIPVDETSDDHAKIIDALAGLGGVEAVAQIARWFEVFEMLPGSRAVLNGLGILLRGQASLELDGVPIADIHGLAYFHEERLIGDAMRDRIALAARSEARIAVLDRNVWASSSVEYRHPFGTALLGDLLTTRMHEFQQPINCCNITAVALSLTALGFPTDINAVFKRCRLPAAYVVDDGLTLAELYDVACTYVHTQGLAEQISVECYHFDEGVTQERDLTSALEESLREAGDDDILVANFGVSIAHADPKLRSGGHFALIGKHNAKTGIVHMVDVNPEKYGRLWLTNTQRLHAAMVDRDSSSYRGRGLLRFAVRRARGRALAALRRDWRAVDMTQRIRAHNDDYMSLFQRSATNLNSLGALSLSMRALGVPDVTADDLMRAGDISYPELLTYVPTPQELNQIARAYLTRAGAKAIVSSVRVYSERRDARGDGADSGPAEWFRTQLAELTDATKLQMIMRVDLNRVLGCEAVAVPTSEFHRTSRHHDYWCVCVGCDAASGTATIADASAATTATWETPIEHLFRGLDDAQDPAIVVLQHARETGSVDFHDLVATHKLVLFKTEDDPWSYTFQTMLANIGVTEVKVVDLSGHELGTVRLRQQLIAHSGRTTVPWLYLQGQSLGDTDTVLEMVNSGDLQAMLLRAGLAVLERRQTPSLDKNIFGYPKGGLTAPLDTRRKVLLAACGSSAADKIPDLVERLLDAGHDVKLLPSRRAEHFFRDFGMQRILARLMPSDIYRDEDEWNFRYTDFGMPIRACHLGLCDWADCLVVAPVTCNTMGKIAHGIADSILTSVFVAWQYQRKPVILCPACNTHMWNNLTTQDNVKTLKRLGARFEGPRSGLLSNGSQGIGMMALPEQIVAAVAQSLADEDDPVSWVIRWGRQAAAADDNAEWARIYRMIDEGVVEAGVRAKDTGDTLLHFAAGGEGKFNEEGHARGVPDLEAAKQLIRRGIDVNVRNQFGFTALDVAVMNGSLPMVTILLDAGADATGALRLVTGATVGDDVRRALAAWAEHHGVTIPANHT
jgi:glutaredoxin-related protein/3-polyprenyl-4-hydroxybenzoate decarboxylase